MRINEKRPKQAVPDIEYFFRANLKLLSSVGFKCSVDQKCEKFKFRHRIPTYITNIEGIVLFALEIYFIVDVFKTDTLLTMQIVSQIISNIQCICKGYLMANTIDEIQQIFENLGTCWRKYNTKEADKVLILGRAYTAMKFCKLHFVCSASCFITFSTPPFMRMFIQYLNREATNHTYDFSTRILLLKYPFEISNVSIYILTNFLEGNLVFICTIFWASSDSLFATVTSHICVQFKVLKNDITSAFNDSTLKERFILVNMVNRHRELLRMCYLIEDIYSPIIFSTTLLSAVNMCVNVYCFRETIAKGYYLETGVSLSLFIGTFLQIFFYCIFAESLTEETRSIADTVYNLKWTTRDHKLRFYIQLIIMRAQNPFYCTAYGFFPIGHKQLTSILNTAFSYYMMLNTMSN